MGNISVTDISQMMESGAIGFADGLSISGSRQQGSDDFSKIMDAANDKVAGSAKSGENTGLPTGRTTVSKNSSERIDRGMKKSADPARNADDRAEVAQDAAKAAGKIEDKIKDAFGIDDEELETAMENMGLASQDLLDPSKLKDLMLEIADVPDSISLITNAEAYNTVKDVMNFAMNELKGIEDKFGISTDQLVDVLSDEGLMQEAISQLDADVSKTDAISAIEETDAADTAADTTTDLAADTVQVTVTDSTETAETTAAQTTDTVSTDAADSSSDADTTTVSETASNITATVSNADSETTAKTTTETSAEEAENAVKAETNESADLGKTETFTEVKKSETDPMKGRNEGFEHASRFSRNEMAENINAGENSVSFDNVTTQTQVNNLGEVVEVVTRYSNADANQILSQVTESIRVDYSADATSLEMQLHPASLGTVNMQVSSTNGVVTAHILVQNEAVKAALEGQLIQLTQAFEEQGQKVEAVEVSVADYDLNQSMNGQQQNGQNEAERQQKEAFRVSGMRHRINLNDFTEGDEETGITEEEKIARDMMARNGNTVDYTV